jgi:3-hydroxy-9,10-secoandrosta-1,3,5(10)-triene-9,17-dione monooxygenase
MQGTGSGRVVIEETFLPEHRSLRFLDAQWQAARDHARHALHSNPVYRGWVSPLLISEVAAVSVGAAREARDIHEEILRNKKTSFQPFHSRYLEQEFQRDFGEALGRHHRGGPAQDSGGLHRTARQHLEEGAHLTDELESRLIFIEQHVIRVLPPPTSPHGAVTGAPSASSTRM